MDNQSEVIGKEFIELTRNNLTDYFVDYNEEDEGCLSKRGFAQVESEIPQKCILVFGVNPAGNDKDAAEEGKNMLYLYYLPEDYLPKEIGKNGNTMHIDHIINRYLMQ